MNSDDAPAPREATILIVEDSPTQALRLQHVLERHDYEVCTAKNGKEALASLRTCLPTLIISDINMPEMDGYELCRRVKDDAAFKSVPLILLTSLSDPKDILKGLECGADNFIVKPYDEEFLLSRIQYVLANLELRRQAGGNLELSKATEKLAQQAQELRAKNEQMEGDLAMARELQTAFLPRHYPVFPAHASPERSAIQFCHRYVTTAELGGDFFDILAISDTAAGVLICDVMGHGVRSALITAIVRGLVEELKMHAADPGRYLSEINRSLCDILKQTITPIFTTAAYVVADLATGELRYASAGHPAPFHLRRGAGALATLDPPGGKSGPALGVFEGASYVTGRQPLASGDMVMLFTDGAYEVEGPGGTFYEKAQMQAAVARRLAQPAPQLFDELVAEVTAFAHDHAFDDDVCLVGMEVARLMPP